MRAILVAAMVVCAASAQGGPVGVIPDDQLTMDDGPLTIAATGLLVTIDQNTYWYEPEADITPYEIAVLLPMFAGPAFGHGNWGATSGRILPHEAMNRGWLAGCRAGTAYARFSTDELKEMGSAARHWKRCDGGWTSSANPITVPR